MKLKNIFFILGIALGFSGCLIFSFYPLYTEKDLFPNDILLGKWIDSDSAIWNFEYKKTGDKKYQKVDSTCYILTIKGENDEGSESSFEVKIIQLAENYFLDFYLNDYEYSEKDSPKYF